MVRIVHEKDKKKAFAKAVEGLSIEKGSTVGIKPNLSIVEEKACTDFELVSFLVEYLTEFSPRRIFIAESDTDLRSISEVYKTQDYGSLEVDLVNVSEEECTTVWPDTTLFFRAFPYPTILNEIDVLISFAKLKTHILTTYTGVLKNQFGLLPFPDKRIFHRFLDKVIVDVNMLIPCHFYLLDGMYAMDGEGPLDGEIIELGLILSGEDPVAIDHCACTLVGIAPHRIAHVVLAEKAGLGEFVYDTEGDVPVVKKFHVRGK